MAYNTTELVDLFRDEMSDAVAPYLWGDTLVYGYIADAQRWFCRLTNGVSDARTAAVTQLAVVPGAEWLPLHKSILKVRGVTRRDTGRPVKVVNSERVGEYGIRFDGVAGPLAYLVQGQDAAALRVSPVAGSADRLQAVTTGITALGATSVTLASTAGLYAGQSVSGTGIAAGTTVASVTGAVAALSTATTAEIPAATALNFDLTLNLSVFRMPLVAITDDGDQALEIDEQHHEHLLMWVKHRAYDKQDAETFDRRKSDDFEARFRSYCASVKKEQDRLRRDVGAVAYGGI